MEACKINTAAVLIVSLVLCSSMKQGSSSESRNTFETNTQFIKTCCNSTRYPDLSVKSLSSYTSEIKTSYTKLMSRSLFLCQTITKSAYSVVSRLSKQKSLKPNEAAALKECGEEIGDALVEIKQSLKELKNISTENYDITMSNVQTWISSALTDEDKCLDGLDEESVSAEDQNTVKCKISEVAQMTSNALALVNRAVIMGSPRPRSP